ncbi:hypothetical protein [Aliidiomarina indica]|uniref:hypothetical protein n=1 Tax=Aliidiomarina indica TaxID=2749147 RepID=UPI001890B528|nr:hypothetical protein [Aliidiomarina indica]
MRFYKILAATFLSLFLASCSSEFLTDRLVSEQESDFAREYLTRLKAKDVEYVRSFLTPELAAQVSDALILDVANYFYPGEPKSVELIGYQVYIINNLREVSITFEYEFESGWNLVNVVLNSREDEYEVLDFHVYQTEGSQSSLHAFDLAEKSPIQYAVLLMAIAVPIFILVTLVACIRTPVPSKKWLWIIFIAVGIGSIQVNWTTAEYAIQLFNIQFFGASAFSAGASAPWIISAAVPWGAIIFWFKRRKYLEQTGQKPEAQ